MSFLDVVKKWYSIVFGIVEDLFAYIMSYDWLAFSFWVVFVLGLLALIAYMTPTLQSTVNMVLRSRRQIERDIRQNERDLRQAKLDQRRVAIDTERATKKRVQEGREQYAQMLLKSKEYSQSRYVTIEGKRYYRKGLVSRGEKMKSSDRDFSGDLEDIDNTSMKGGTS